MIEASAPKKATTSGMRPLRLFVGALAGLGAGGLALLWRESTTIASFHIPWLVLAFVFYLAETCLVHLHFRRGAHSFSMSEVPLVLGLFFATPRELLIAQFAGCAVALAVQRRQSPLKATFNLANFAVTSSVAVLVLRATVTHGAHFGLTVWLATALTILTCALLGALNVNVAISLSERRIQPARIGFAFVLLLGSAFTNVSIGLVAATVIDYRPSAAWLLAIPAATVFVAYRAYIREREKHEILEFLYAANRILTQNPDLEKAIVALLEQARAMFRTETAEAIVAPPDSAPLLRIRVDNSGQPKVMAVVSEPAMLSMWDRIANQTSPIVLGAHRAHRQLGLARRAAAVSMTVEDQEYLSAQGLRNAMVAPLRGETRAIGMLMLGDRLGESAVFQSQDKRLFEALASHVSVALENGRLEQSLVQLRELEQKLTQLAFHDPLTGLANRTRFAERVVDTLSVAKAEDRTCAVLFIDLDDFKTVNDTLGHEAGDQLLQVVAERITGCLRPSDQPARLGGDEFAIIIEDALTSHAAERVAARITDALRLPIVVNGCELYTRASIGIATSQDVHSADEMLRNADLAMYMAKGDGKGRYRWFRSSMRAEVVQRHQLKSDLERAADRGEFQVHYQPIVDLRTRHSDRRGSLGSLGSSRPRTHLPQVLHLDGRAVRADQRHRTIRAAQRVLARRRVGAAHRRGGTTAVRGVG